MNKNITGIVIVVTIIIIVAVVILMKNNANSKKMEALIREAELRSIERETEYNARKKDKPVVEIVSTVVNPPTKDVEIIGDQSLALDEDPTDEYDEMADVSGISKITPPKTDENWVKKRQVEPVKDLSVGIAITNDVSKKENLQTGKTSSKYPIKKGTGVRAECADGKCGDPSKYPTQKPVGSIRRMDGTYSNPIELARVAAQKRDSDVKRVLDEKVRSQAKNAVMKQQKYADTSKIKQYDVRPLKAPPANLTRPVSPSFGSMRPMGPSFGSMRPTRPSFGSMRPMGPSFGSMRPTVMPSNPAMKARQAAMKAQQAAAHAEKEEKMKAAMKAQQAAAHAEKEEKMKAGMKAQQAAKKAAEQAAKKAAEQADIKSLNETGFTVKELQKRATMKAQQAAAHAEKEDKMKAAQAAMKAAMKAATMKVEGYEIMKPWGSMVY